MTWRMPAETAPHERTWMAFPRQNLTLGDDPASADVVFMAPRGDRALARVLNDLYVVTVPVIGGDTPTISVANPENASFPARRLTDVGGEFPAWSADGQRVHFSLGNAHFVYDLARAEAFEDSVEAAARISARRDAMLSNQLAARRPTAAERYEQVST